MSLPYFITWDKQKTSNTFEIESYESSYFRQENDERILDLSSISYQCPLGGRPKPIIDKIKDQMDKFCCASPKSKFDLKHKVSMRLLNYLGIDHGKLFYTVSGAEAVENALKIARIKTGKNIILAREISYHGATLGALSITGDWRNQASPTVDQWTRRIPEPEDDPELIKTEAIINEVGADKIAAICLETITGGNGVIIPTKSWFKGIKALCDKYDIILILDEVINAFERCGKPFAFHLYDIQPDMVCMAKNITAGIIPFGAVWVGKKIADHFNDNVLPCGLTNYAHPLGLAATDGMLDIVTDYEFLESHKKLIASFANIMKSFIDLEDVKEVRQIGLLAAVELKKKLDPRVFLKNNIYIAYGGDNIVFSPSYIISEKELLTGTRIIKRIIEE